MSPKPGLIPIVTLPRKEMTACYSVLKARGHPDGVRTDLDGRNDEALNNVFF